MTSLKTTLSAFALAATMAATVVTGAFAQGKGTVGIAMPTKSSARWIDDGNNIVKILKERGYGAGHRIRHLRLTGTALAPAREGGHHDGQRAGDGVVHRLARGRRRRLLRPSRHAVDRTVRGSQRTGNVAA